MSLQKALGNLEESISYFEKVKKHSNNKQLLDSYEVTYTVARDSIVKRFKYTIELFWKFLRLYLEQAKQMNVESNTPGDTIRSACQARIIDEQSATMCLRMIKSRNLTSHIYKEEIAAQLAQDIPQYYLLMKKISSSLQ